MTPAPQLTRPTTPTRVPVRNMAELRERLLAAKLVEAK